MEYQCHKNNECMVDRVTRNRCQKCRFDKCLQVGMCRETVRLDKNRKRKAKDEDREIALEETKNVMELLKSVSDAYSAAFLPTFRINSIADAESAIRKFWTLIPQFGPINDSDRERLLQGGLKPFLVTVYIIDGL